MNKDNSSHQTYYRIGINYYKIVYQPLSDGTVQEKRVSWSYYRIIEDYSKDFVKKIPKLDGFCNHPSNINYERIHKNFYNLYTPLPFKPTNNAFPEKSLSFLNHIFGEQLDLGLDYIKILYEQPMQQLPILCLVSKERETGKSSFINWMKAIFGENMTINSNENFQSNFNSDWAAKLIIATEETLLNRKEDSERFKNLSTAKFVKVEAKGVDRQEIEFFGKFILCSNNEDNFIYLEKDEIRFWVRKISPFSVVDPNYLNKLKEEIPDFLGYVLQRALSTTKKTRMWFTPAQLQTSALRRLKNANVNKVEYELANTLMELIDNKEDTEALHFTLSDATEYIRHKKMRATDTSTVKRILHQQWKLNPIPNARTYTNYYFSTDGNIFKRVHKGRYFSVDKKFIESLDILLLLLLINIIPY